MRKVVFRVIAVFLCVFVITGCAEFKEKFMRKSKEEKVKTQKYYAVKKYDIHPSLELYTKRYTFWKSWHREILDVLAGDSNKKKNVAMEQATSNLFDMQRMLVDEKAEKMQPYLDKMVKLSKRIRIETLTQGNEVRIRHQLETMETEIKRNFSYNKMKNFIREDFRQKPAEAAGIAEPLENAPAGSDGAGEDGTANGDEGKE